MWKSTSFPLLLLATLNKLAQATDEATIDERREAVAIFGMKQFRSEIRPFSDLIQETIRWSRYPNEWKRLKDVFHSSEMTQSIKDFIGKYDNVTSAFADDQGEHMVIGNTMFTSDFLITVNAYFRITDLAVRIKLRDDDIRDLGNLPRHLEVCLLTLLHCLLNL